MRVLQVITSLDVGGAETLLSRLVRSLPTDRFQCSVISLTGLGSIGSELRARGIDVLPVDGAKGLLSIGQLRAALAYAQRARPLVIHTWMYHANVVGHLVRRSLAGQSRPALITSVRGAMNAPSLQRWSTRLVRKVDALLSSRCDRVVFNSQVAAGQHWGIGYCRRQSIVIPNGFDVHEFRPDAKERGLIRAELGIESSDPVIGVVARFHPLKGHAPFIAAARQLLVERPKVTFVLVGRGCVAENPKFADLLGESVGDRRFRLLGERHDVANIMSALDALVCPSLSESFPNTVGEAMSCGVPCIVTDVGDCRTLVGDSGCVVNPGDVAALRAAMLAMVDKSPEIRVEIGALGRTRIAAHFSKEAMLAQYEQLYDDVAGKVQAWS